MRRYILLIICAYTLHSAAQQITFNRRYLANPAVSIKLYTSFCSVVATDSGYYVSGMAPDSVSPNNTGMSICFLDLHGNIIRSSLYFMPSAQDFTTNSNNLIPYHAGFLNLSYASINGSDMPVLSFINSLGGVASQQAYLLDTSTIDLTFIVGYDESLNYINGNIYNATNTGWLVDSNLLTQCPCLIYLTKSDSAGHRIWSQSYGMPNLSNLFPAVNFLGTDTVLLAYGEYNGGWGELSHVRILVLDTAGNYVRNFYNSPDSDIMTYVWGGLIKTRDNGYVFGSAKGWWQQVQYPYDVLYKGIAVKLDSTGQEQWRYINPGDSTDSAPSDISSVTETHDGSIIAAGNMLLYDNIADSPYQFMTMAKLSADGRPLWNRRYTYFSSTSGFLTQQNFSVKECPDRGYILCGISDSGANVNNTDERGWLIKTDSFGCLVPGCQLYDYIQEVATDSLSIILYPNPATDYINFILHSPLHHTFDLSMTNLDGQTVFKASVSPDVTDMISTRNFPDGEYILSFTDHAGKALQKRVIVLK